MIKDIHFIQGREESQDGSNLPVTLITTIYLDKSFMVTAFGQGITEDYTGKLVFLDGMNSPVVDLQSNVFYLQRLPNIHTAVKNLWNREGYKLLCQASNIDKVEVINQGEEWDLL